jgi:hypothetical protein
MIGGEEILPAKVVYTLAMLSRSMARNVSVAVASLLILSIRTPAQQFPPGYVDPAPLLAAASNEIGEATLKCITYSGTGYGGAVGQTYENAVNVDWPRIDALANYTRTINWETATGERRGTSTVTASRSRFRPRSPSSTSWICG